MASIEHIEAREILDSRGNTTVEVEVLLEDGTVSRALGDQGSELLVVTSEGLRIYGGEWVFTYEYGRGPTVNDGDGAVRRNVLAYLKEEEAFLMTTDSPWWKNLRRKDGTGPP